MILVNDSMYFRLQPRWAGRLWLGNLNWATPDWLSAAGRKVTPPNGWAPTSGASGWFAEQSTFFASGLDTTAGSA